MSSAVNEVQFPIANGSVSSRLNLRNSMLRARSLQIVGGRFCNLKNCSELSIFLLQYHRATCFAPSSEFSAVSGTLLPMEEIAIHCCRLLVLKKEVTFTFIVVQYNRILTFKHLAI
jgi:hypothetical protein